MRERGWCVSLLNGENAPVGKGTECLPIGSTDREILLMIHVS